MSIRNVDTKPSISVYKVVVSYFCGMLSYLVIGSIGAVLLSLVMGFLYSFDITRSILDFIFFLRKDGGNLFIVTTSCFFAAIAMETIVRRINANSILQAQRALWGIGVSFLILGIVMLIVNFITDQSVIGNIFMILVGFYFKSTNKVDFHAAPDSNNSSTTMNASDKSVALSDVEVPSASNSIPEFKSPNKQRVFNVIVALFIIASVGINIFLFTEIQRYNSQQSKLVDNVNYLLSSNEELQKTSNQLAEELHQTTWRSKVNAFTFEELQDALGTSEAFWMKWNAKDENFLDEADSNRIFSDD